MKRAVLLCLIVLAACKPAPPRASEPVPPPMNQIPDKPAPPVTIKPTFQCPGPEVEGEPILPPEVPLTELQTLICDQPELALLDRQVHEAYLAARLRGGVDRAGLSKAQRQWEAGREICLKAADPRDCVAEASRTRLAELVLQDPATVARSQLEFTCNGTATPLTAAFYSRLRPSFAVLGFGRQQAIVFVEPNNAGLKYGRTGVDFFVRQGQVSAEFYGRKLACVSPTWRPSQEPDSPPPDSAVVPALAAAQAPDEQAAPPLPALSPPVRPSAAVKPPVSLTAAQQPDAQVKQVAPPQSKPSPPVRPSAAAKAPVSLTAAQQPDAQVKQVAPPQSKPSSPLRPSAAAKVPVSVTAAQAPDAQVKQVAPPPKPSPPVRPSAAAKVPVSVTAAQAPDAQVKQVAPAPTQAPVRTRASAGTKNVAAAQATDALVRQVLAQARAVPSSKDAQAPSAAGSGAKPAKGAVEAPASSRPVEAKP